MSLPGRHRRLPAVNYLSPDPSRTGTCMDGPQRARFFCCDVQSGRLQSCIRPVDAAIQAAGLDGIRGLGPITFSG